MDIIYIILIVFAILYFHSKSQFTDDILNTNYTNNGTDIPSCNYTVNERRPYPSGKIPGSYLGLSPSEKEMLIVKFMDYNGSLSQYQPFVTNKM